MEAEARRVIESLERRAEAEHQEIKRLSGPELESRRDNFVLPVGHEVGALMNAAIRGSKAQLIAELGTCRGYSTIWLADAARATGGRVITVESDSRKIAEARGNVEQAGLTKQVEFCAGDAVALATELRDGVDFALIDVWKELYIPCFDAIYTKLAAGAIVVADNMLFPVVVRADADAYRRHIRTKPGIESVLLPIGSGIEVSRRV